MRLPPGVVKLIVDDFSKGNPRILASGGVLHDSRGMPMTGFGSFLGYHLILYDELMAISEGLELAVQLGYFMLQVKSNSATAVYWVLSNGLARWGMLFSCIEFVL